MYRVLMPGEPEVRLEVSKAVLASRPGQGQDRVAIVRVRGGYVVAVADGAGGLGGGAKAADRALRDVAAHARTDLVQEPQAWTSLLEGTDAALASAGGQCAIVLASVIGTRIVGASVGDCGAWLVDDTTTDLTAKQFRKPLLGSGASSAVPFEAELNPGATLLLASDGLLKHAPHDRIWSLVREPELCCRRALPCFHAVSHSHCADRSSTNSQTLHNQCAMDAPTMVPVRFRSQAKSSAGMKTARRQGAGVSR